MSKCLHENLLKHDDRNLHDILVEVNKSMKQLVDPIKGHQQAIEYREINMKFKAYLVGKEELEEIEEMKRESKIFIRKFKNIKIEEFQYFCNKFDVNFDKKVFVNEAKKEIRIYDKQELDLKDLFKLLDTTWYIMNKNDKHFKILIIVNRLLESIDEDILGEISFDKIVIGFCPKLKRIHWNAFGKQTKIIKVFSASHEFTKLISEPDSDYDLMKLINSLVECEEIHIEPFHPELQPIKLNKLKILDLNGKHSSIKISSICDYAFNECNQIQKINLKNNNISYISEHAFYFENESYENLEIDLQFNNLNHSSFATDALVNFKRPVKINLNGNEIKIISEEVLKFLNLNQQNGIQFDESNENSRNSNYQNDKLIRRLNSFQTEQQISEEYRTKIFEKRNNSFKNLWSRVKRKNNLTYTNEDIESIEENNFDEIKFNNIAITDCPKLQKIHYNAFGRQTDKIEKFYAWNLLPNLKSEPNSDYDIIKLINSLVNCEEITLNSFHYQLQPINLKKLKIIILCGFKSSNKIHSINDNAFYECDQIEVINLSWNNISYINEHKFNLRNEYDKKLTIDLKHNKLS